MARVTKGRGFRVAVVAGIFAAGFVCGSVSHRRTEAQLKDLGGAAMEKAAGSGGPLGSAAKLGTAIVDMQQHLDALQKNVDTLEQVKAALGG